MNKTLTTLALALGLTAALSPAAWASHEHTPKRYAQAAYSDHSDLYTAAKDLDKAAQRLYRRLKRDAEYSPLTYQAADLANAAGAFYELVERGTRTRHLKRRYRALDDCLQQIRSQFYQRQYPVYSRRVERQLERTRYALQEVENNLFQQYQYSYHDGNERRRGKRWGRY